MRHPHYRFVPIPDGISGPSPIAIEDVEACIIALSAACEPHFRDKLAAVLEEDEYSGDAVACLVAGAHLLPMFQVAAVDVGLLHKLSPAAGGDSSLLR